ncbi:MAG TPA: 30S ribosomal protein S18 [Patescibacteria group bacterium]|nr:30S ribosomal protein S18 [Patescibacteria group bacterium]
MPKQKSKPRRKVPTNLKCYFCENKKTPNYLETDELKRFVTERGKIASREYTGTCSKHQKQVAQAVKRARHLALLPFKASV